MSSELMDNSATNGVGCTGDDTDEAILGVVLAIKVECVGVQYAVTYKLAISAVWREVLALILLLDTHVYLRKVWS